MIENTGKPHIVVVNHQAANIHSVGKALEWGGADVEVTDSAESLIFARDFNDFDEILVILRPPRDTF